MKSRVINSRNFDFNFQDKLFTGYTSKLKPSLFYGNKKIESVSINDEAMSDKELLEDMLIVELHPPSKRFCIEDVPLIACQVAVVTQNVGSVQIQH